jgi:hypothetical protein
MAGVLGTTIFTGVLLAAGLPQASAGPGAADRDSVVIEHTSDLAQGARVRVTAHGAARRQLTGSLLTLDEKTLTIVDSDGQAVKIPREIVTHLDVSWGRKRNVLPGLLIGAAAGGLIAAILPLCDSYDGTCSTRGELITGGVIAFGGIGAGVGALVRSDKWVEMPMGRVRVGLQPIPARRGAGLALTLGF